jgi:hypothetical protein
MTDRQAKNFTLSVLKNRELKGRLYDKLLQKFAGRIMAQVFLDGEAFVRIKGGDISCASLIEFTMKHRPRL